jgi:transposase
MLLPVRGREVLDWNNPLVKEKGAAKPSTGSGLGRYRWVVERTFAWLHQFKRLLVRYARRAHIHEALLAIGFCVIGYRRFRNAAS